MMEKRPVWSCDEHGVLFTPVHLFPHAGAWGFFFFCVVVIYHTTHSGVRFVPLLKDRLLFFFFFES